MPHIVRKSFADVGLWPWNPDWILENCLKFCPVDSQQQEDETMRDLIDAVTSIGKGRKNGMIRLCLVWRRQTSHMQKIMILSFSGKKCKRVPKKSSLVKEMGHVSKVQKELLPGTC